MSLVAGKRAVTHLNSPVQDQEADSNYYDHNAHALVRGSIMMEACSSLVALLIALLVFWLKEYLGLQSDPH